MRLAARYGDKEAEKRFLKKYAELGGTPGGVRDSFERMHPASGLTKVDQKDFLASLTSQEKEDMARAVRFYNEVILGSAPQALILENLEDFKDVHQKRDYIRSTLIGLEARKAVFGSKPDIFGHVSDLADPAKWAEANAQAVELLRQAGGPKAVLKQYREDLEASRREQGNQKKVTLDYAKKEWRSRRMQRIKEIRQEARGRSSAGESLLKAAD